MLNKTFLITIALLFTYMVGIAQVVSYQAPNGIIPSDRYEVKVNGKPIFVYKNEVSGIAYFSFSGNIEVEITTSYDIKWVDVRPKALNINPQFSGNKMRFSLSKPCNLSIELNGESTQPLYLFASPLEESAPTASSQNVRFFEGGKIHEVGTLTLKSGQSIYIAGGAIVRGNIVAENAKNIKIKGRGILDGSLVKEQLIVMKSCEDIQMEGFIILNSQTWTVVPKWCNNLKINNLKQICWHTGTDGIDLCGTSNVLINNCFFRNNDDNIVLKSWGISDEKYAVNITEKGPDMTNIIVENCVFWNMPWGNAIEIGFELKCDKISNIIFRNIDLIHVERGAALSIHNGDFATVEDILFSDIRVEDAMHKLIDVAIFRSQYSIDRPKTPEERTKQYMNGAWDGVSMVPKGQETYHAQFRGKIRNITFRNIAVTDGQVPFSILSGYDDAHIIENVVIDNLTIHGKRIKSAKEGRFFIENTKAVSFK